MPVAMNLYGCIPSAYFNTHPALAYWSQASSLARLPTSDEAITSANLALNLKKSQLPLNLSDVIQKSRSTASLRTGNDDTPSSFRVTQTVSSARSSDVAIARLELQSLQAHIQYQRHQQHGHHHHGQQHRPFSATPPPVGNGLAPLQALCDADVSTFTSKKASSSDSGSDGKRGGLKFGMSRILSEDFGKTKNEKENSFQLSSVPEACRSLPLCPCNSPTCTAYAQPPNSYPPHSISSLSAVHALQPPSYPLSGSVDALPGLCPYSILSTDSNSANQPKRKRSWSRAVFSNLQRKGLEKRFEVQKYVTKPDRRQLAAMLGLTDAQVKVWFQNRRMKWRHAQQQGEKDKQLQQQQSTTDTDVKEENPRSRPNTPQKTEDVTHSNVAASPDLCEEGKPTCTPVDSISQKNRGLPTTSIQSPAASTSSEDCIDYSKRDHDSMDGASCTQHQTDISVMSFPGRPTGRPLYGKSGSLPPLDRPELPDQRMPITALPHSSLVPDAGLEHGMTSSDEDDEEMPLDMEVEASVGSVVRKYREHDREGNAEEKCSIPVVDRVYNKDIFGDKMTSVSSKDGNDDSGHFDDSSSCEIDVSN